MKISKEKSLEPFLTAAFTALAGAIFGLFLSLSYGGGSPYPSAALGLLGGLTGLLFWLRTNSRFGREIGLAASLPWAAFLIPLSFLTKSRP